MTRPASPILERLLAKADKAKRLRFDEFQEIALYDPELGYFARSSMRAGREGDFLTAPETSPLFAECIAQVLQEDASRLGADEFHLIEVGAGRGTFAANLF